MGKLRAKGVGFVTRLLLLFCPFSLRLWWWRWWPFWYELLFSMIMSRPLIHLQRIEMFVQVSPFLEGSEVDFFCLDYVLLHRPDFLLGSGERKLDFSPTLSNYRHTLLREAVGTCIIERMSVSTPNVPNQ